VILDLQDTTETSHDVSCDVLVIGGGIAGLLLATRLAAHRRRVVVLESGGRTQPEESHPLNEVVLRGDRYAGAEAGRFRCLGGTSSRWGGAMLPFRAADMEQPHPGWDVEWPVALSDFTAWQYDVETLFRLPDSDYERPDIMTDRSGGRAAFITRLGKWPPFRLRNVAALLEREIAANDGPTIWLHATVTRFELDPAGRLAAVEAQAGSGRRLRVRAPETVLAAGAIESTRLLLLADRQHDERIFAPDDVLGRYLHDHLSAPTARLDVKDRAALNRVAGFRFEGRGMRNLRFEPGDALRAEHGLPAAFAHIGFSTDGATGFETLRNLYRRLQSRQRPTAGEIAALGRDLPWLCRAAWWRLVEKRLLFPQRSALDLHMVVEQEPLASQRITLSDERRDVFGCPLAVIDWRVGEGDIANAMALTTHFIAAWKTSTLSDLAGITALPPDTIRTAMKQGGGIYHPGGTIRMGTTPRRGVVDRDLRCFRVPNLTVVSTAVFPSGGGTNPTMMLMMAALRAADRLGQRTVGG
jgi:choline dehydrogenase-like flavoprotein